MLAYFKRVTIRLSQSNKKKKTKSKSNKYSTWTLSVFLAFSILAIGNLLNSATEGFKNFGQFQDVLAAIGVAPNRDEIAAGSGSESLIIDAYDRCLVVDPNLADDDNPSGQTVPLYRYAGLSSIEVYGENIGGINVGNTIDGGPNTAILDKTVELGMSFSIGIITQPGSVQGAVSFIEESNARDLVPIVRLCYPGGCGFDMNGNPGSVTDFFRQVEAQADGNFIAMIGPNEAGTSGEMESFDYALGDYEELVRDMMAIATDLQSIGSEKMLIAPGAFNLTNTQQNDARNILTSPSFDPSKVNVLLFNAYDLPSGDAYSFYSTDSVFNLQAYASQNNLPVIMTEFGTFSGNYDQLKLSAQRLCADPNFAGILGFRSFTSLGRDLQPNPRPGPTFSDEQWANEILASCDPKDLFSANGGTTTADYAWLSCNLDSCIYEKEFDERSVAKAVSSVAEKENSEEMEYALKIKCGRNVPNLPDCITERQLTAQVLMPIRQFGSNNPKGEDFYGYPSYCAELASYFESNNATIDPLNQFAGILESENGGNYPMPWLGSAINCSGELAKGTSEFAGVSDLDYEPNPGSLISNTYEDIFYDFINGVGRPGSPAIDFSGLLNDDQLAQLGNRNANDLQNMIADERAICGINGDPEQCLDITSNANFVSSLRPYVPVDVPISYKRPEGKNSSNMIIRDEDYNYIHGPEVLLGEKELVYEEYSDVLCREYAQRNTGAANPGLKFEDDTNCGVRPLPGEENNPSFIGATVEARNVSACSTLRSFCSLDQIADGQCDTNSLGGNIYAGCFTLGPKGMNAWSTIKENQSLEERDIPEYQIPGIYDSLFYSNQRLQTIMSQRNLKIVFFENVGWEVKTKLKVRDAGREFEGDLSANYSQQISNEFASCQAPQEIFNNEYYLARGEAEIERSQYYDWLGVLDIMQEYITVYSRDGVNTAENAYVNPIFNEDDSSDDELSRLIEEFNLEAGDLSPGLRKQALLSSGSASLATRFPIPTCDDIEIAKLRAAQTDTEDDDYLIGKYFTCITFANDSTYDNVSDSTETLNDFLCKKGYQVKGVCEDAVCRVDDIARDNYSGAKVEQIDGGVKATIDNPESIVTREYSSTVRVDQFIEETDTQLATNGPFMLNAFGGAKAEGLVKAHNGELKFVDTYRGMTHAIVKHDGALQKNITNNSDYGNYSYNLVAGDKYSQPTIVAANEDYAIIYIFEMARCREDLKSQIEAEGRNLNACPSRLYTRADVDNILGILNSHVDFAISGAALITVDGNEASTSVFNDSEAAARTIIGWDTSDELVLGVLDAANLTGMKNYANSNNLETALLLDGGGSTQMYYEPGFSTVISGYQPNPDIADDMNKDQVYWPGRPNESGPRARDFFIGVKLNTDATNVPSSPSDNPNVSQGDITLFPAGVNNPIPGCREPDAGSLRTVNTDRPYFAGTDTSRSASSGLTLRDDAADALETMLTDMRNNDSAAYNSCGFNWGYRSAETQASFETCGSGTGTACACESEHQLGTTVDFRPADGSQVNEFDDAGKDACFNWLTNNAANYGFVRSYFPNNPDGYGSEPWHWRWLGRDVALDFQSKRDDFGGHLRNYLEDRYEGTTGSYGSNTVNFNIDPTNGVGRLTLEYGGGFTTDDGVTFSGHNGLDYAAPEGTPITAAADGKVVLIGSDEEGYGEYVIIEHTLFNGNKIYTLYAHMSEVLVLKDQEVNYGQEIGLMGTTGNSTGTHLHFEVRRGDGPLDPLVCADGYDDNPRAGIDLGDCTFDPQGEELQEVLAGGLDGGSQEICSSLDNPNVRNFDTLDCLIATVASFVSNDYSETLGSQFVYPPSLLKATLIRESSARIKAADGTRSDYTGNPLERSHYTDASGNDISLSSDAVGPMQFTGIAFEDLMNRNREVFIRCIENLGIDANALTPEIRSYIGPALCAGAIKQISDVQGGIGDSIRDLNSATAWEEQRYSSDVGQFLDDDIVDYELSAIHIAARRYYGRCFFDFGDGVTGDYCQEVYNLTRSTPVQCNASSTQPTL